RNRDDNDCSRCHSEAERKPARPSFVARRQQSQHCTSYADNNGSDDRLLGCHAIASVFLGAADVMKLSHSGSPSRPAREDARPARRPVFKEVLTAPAPPLLLLEQALSSSSNSSSVARTVGVNSPPGLSDCGCTPSSQALVLPFASACLARRPSESLCVEICGNRAAISLELSSTTDPGALPNSTASRNTTWSYSSSVTRLIHRSGFVLARIT